MSQLPDAEHAALRAVFHDLDRRTDRFAAHAGIRCPPGCGACCHSPHVEATVAELAPLAAALVAQDRAVVILDRLAAARDAGDSRCVLFTPDPDGAPDRGRCSMYAERPSVCRLFGFGGRRDPDGAPQFRACRHLAEREPERIARAQQLVATGAIALPIISECASRVRAVAGGSDAVRPINDALAEAVSRAALRARLRDDDTVTDGTSDQHDDRPPRRPDRTPRAA